MSTHNHRANTVLFTGRKQVHPGHRVEGADPVLHSRVMNATLPVVLSPPNKLVSGKQSDPIVPPPAVPPEPPPPAEEIVDESTPVEEEVVEPPPVEETEPVKVESTDDMTDEELEALTSPKAGE